MFSERALPADLAAVREAHAPEALVLDVEQDFETMDPAVAEELGFLVDALDPLRYPEAWLPPDAPTALQRVAGPDFTIGAPGDGSVAWTRQTDPPAVLVKPRVEGSPEDFVDFLVATALVEVGLEVPVPTGETGDAAASRDADVDTDVDTDADSDPDATVASGADTEAADRPPEQFLGFFGERYRDLAAATPLDPTGTYQLAAALYDAWLGLHTREVFASWLEEHPRLGAAWQDAGDRIEPRLGDLHREVARGETSFPEATELACAAVKHALELPAPYGALDTTAYRDGGSPYAVTWAEKTFAALEEEE